MASKFNKETEMKKARKAPFLTHEEIVTGNCTLDSIPKLKKDLQWCGFMLGNQLTVEEIGELAKMIAESAMEIKAELKATGESK